MTGILDGPLSDYMGGLMAGLYSDGTLHRVTKAQAANGTVTSTSVDVPVKLQVDAATFAMRAEQGYEGGDVRILVLQTGIGQQITTSDRITDAKGRRWLVASVGQDPAGVCWEIHGRPQRSG